MTNRSDGAVLTLSEDLVSSELVAFVPGPEEVTVEAPWGPFPMDAPLGRTTVLTVGPDGQGLCVGTQEDFEIRCVDTTRGPTLIRWNGDPVPVRADDPEVERWRERQEAMLGMKVASPELRSILDDVPTPDLRPPYTHIALDSEDVLWVQVASGLDDVPSHELFRMDGTWLGSIQLGSLRLMDAGADYVLGVRQDEFGVEYLEQWSLSRGETE